jgi:hypothetical protein
MILSRRRALASEFYTPQVFAAPALDGGSSKRKIEVALFDLHTSKPSQSKGFLNGHGPWWNAGASHMNEAVPTFWISQQGLVSLVQEHRRFQCSG